MPRYNIWSCLVCIILELDLTFCIGSQVQVIGSQPVFYNMHLHKCITISRYIGLSAANARSRSPSSSSEWKGSMPSNITSKIITIKAISLWSECRKKFNLLERNEGSGCRPWLIRNRIVVLITIVATLLLTN